MNMIKKICLVVICSYSPLYCEGFFDSWSNWNKSNRDYLMRSVKTPQGDNTPSNNIHRSRNNENKSTSPVTFKDIIGGVPQEVLDLKAFLEDDSAFKAVGAERPRGILLVGPPGTGKTLLAQAIAGELSAFFFPTSASAFVEIFVGNGAKHVRELFEEASIALREAPGKKAIIFIDEFDAIGSRNSVMRDGGEEARTINELLVQMDGFDKEANIIVMAATNNTQSLDKALLRPGRFDVIINIPLPDFAKRYALLKYYCFNKKRTLDEKIDIETFAQRTEGFNCAEIKDLVNKAAINAARKNSSCIMHEDFEKAYQELRKLKKLYR